jgi:hypothetical protein
MRTEERPKRRLENNINLDVRELVLRMGYRLVAQNSVHWWVFGIAVLNLPVILT